MVEVKSNLNPFATAFEVVEGKPRIRAQEIPAGGSESYSTTIEGSRSGSASSTFWPPSRPMGRFCRRRRPSR